MRLAPTPCFGFLIAAIVGGCGVLGSNMKTLAADAKPAKAGDDAKPSDITEFNLLNAAKDGLVRLEAEGLGDGRMEVAVTNVSRKPLKVVLPPGLIASGTTGQFGGMGGMGGGMGGMGGGMGGMGGGMGGMGGGMMGGMGGGMGGMGGGMMGGMGGGMGGRGGMMGGGMSGGTMPASMGMMMLGRLIMTIVGDKDSWNMSSLMMGSMMGGMGGMGGGMGGMGMGGMGGGMGMGGRGGGFRSVPPTGEPYATLNPGQTRRLPTRLVRLGGPVGEGVAMPYKGEKLQLGDIKELTAEPRIQAALRRLAMDKAPTNVSQLVLWRVVSNFDWETIGHLSNRWANTFEIALAKQFVAQLEMPGSETDMGRIFVDVNATGNSDAVSALRSVLIGRTMLGVKVESTVPARPSGPSVACKINLVGDEAQIQLARSNGRGQWSSAIKFTLKIDHDDTGKAKMAAFGDTLAEALVTRFINAKLTKSRASGKEGYRVQIANNSPLILNGLALSGGDPSNFKLLVGFSISPQRTLTFPASLEVVQRLGLKQSVHVQAADLSGL